VLRKGKDAVVFANGDMVSSARQAADKLAGEGIDLTVADLHTIQPFDVEGVLSLIEESKTVFVAEEHNRGRVLPPPLPARLSIIGLMVSNWCASAFRLMNIQRLQRLIRSINIMDWMPGAWLNGCVVC
jgi:pyruvate/2-oxoacid:ferredoxin oxidoreductase alpha subunit